MCVSTTYIHFFYVRACVCVCVGCVPTLVGHVPTHLPGDGCSAVVSRHAYTNTKWEGTCSYLWKSVEFLDQHSVVCRWHANASIHVHHMS